LTPKATKAKRAKAGKPAAGAKAGAPTPLQGRFNLVTCVVQRGFANMVAKAAMEAGAKGATILPARGMGMGQMLAHLGQSIVPQKEVVTIVCLSNATKAIYEAVTKAGKMDQMGQGIAYTTPISEVAGLYQDAATG
jgi:nitrogen regulatory protein P-II 1